METPQVTNKDQVDAQGGLPRVIGGFEIRRKLGQGGMGAVFEAYQPSLDRIVALKLLPPSIAKDRAFIERFQREARTSAKLNHPNVVAGIDVGRDEASGLWYFAMEYVDGPTLKHVLNRRRALSEEEALKIVRQIGEALVCAEKHGIVHRDIKPDNILLTARGVAKLADLGLARQTGDEDASLTRTGQAVGTPYYMAPEQARGQKDSYDTRTDIYALGATLFHMVTGKPPFEGETGAVIMAKHLNEKPPLAHRMAPSVSESCGRLIARMMSKEMNQRPGSAAELLAQIDLVLAKADAPRGEAYGTPRRAHRAVQDRQRGAEAYAPAGNKGLPLPLILGGAGALLLVVLIWAFAGGGTPANRSAANVPAKPDLPAAKTVSPESAALAPKTAPPVAPKPAEAPPKVPEPVAKSQPPAPPPVAEPAKPALPEPPAPPPEMKAVKEPDAPAVPLPPDPAQLLAQARAAYAGKKVEFLELLRKGEAAKAADLVGKMKRDPALKPVADYVALDEKALGWFGELDAAVVAGLKTVKPDENLVLLFDKSGRFEIGPGAEFILKGITDTEVELHHRKQNFQMPQHIGKLLLGCKAMLAARQWAGAEDGKLRIAFLELVAIDGSKGAPSVGDGRAKIADAEKAGAALEQVAWLNAAMDLVAQGAREARANILLAEFDRCFAAKDWKGAERAGNELLKDLADTEALKKRAGFAEEVATAERKGSPIQEYHFTLQEGAAAPEVGLEKYEGSQATHLRQGTPTHAYYADNVGSAEAPQIGASGCGPEHGLFRFKVLQSEGGILPEETEILEAKFSVCRPGRDSYPVLYEIREVREAWEQKEATWKVRLKDTPWSTPGAMACERLGDGEKPGFDEKTFVTFDVTESLKKMLADKANYGWCMRCVSGPERKDYRNAQNLAGTAWKDPELRPKLELKIRCPRIKGAPAP